MFTQPNSHAHAHAHARPLFDPASPPAASHLVWSAIHGGTPKSVLPPPVSSLFHTYWLESPILPCSAWAKLAFFWRRTQLRLPPVLPSSIPYNTIPRRRSLLCDRSNLQPPSTLLCPPPRSCPTILRDKPPPPPPPSTPSTLGTHRRNPRHRTPSTRHSGRPPPRLIATSDSCPSSRERVVPPACLQRLHAREEAHAPFTLRGQSQADFHRRG